MPRVYKKKDGTTVTTYKYSELGEYLSFIIPRLEAFSEGLRKTFDGTPRTEDPASSNKSLAPRKPAGSRAKGKPAKGSKPPRKVADKG